MNCTYCGKPDTPVRNVPAPVPFSDCYCDDCSEKARDEAVMGMLTVALSKLTSSVEIDRLEQRFRKVLAKELQDVPLAAKVSGAFADARGRLGP